MGKKAPPSQTEGGAPAENPQKKRDKPDVGVDYIVRTWGAAGCRVPRHPLQVLPLHPLHFSLRSIFDQAVVAAAPGAGGATGAATPAPTHATNGRVLLSARSISRTYMCR